MVNLSDATLALLPDDSTARPAEEVTFTAWVSAPELDFLEAVTFADADDIVRSLRQAFDQDWMGLPVWVRNLAFRLACLQRPNDADLHRQAAADLRSFGPDWDEVADELVAHAERLDQNG